MRLVFCGTPEFAVGTLEAVLAAGHEVSLVVCQPDRAAGRGMALQVGAVKAAALLHALPVVQPDRIKKNDALRTQLEALQPDAILVVAYGRIIPDWMLALPRFGCLNLHGSLLPKYRGAAPIQWALACGETHTGVTTMRLDAGLDTGPLLMAQVEPIAPEASAPDLFASLAAVGAALMVETLAALEAGTVTPIEQDHAAASLAPILTRDDGRMDYTRTASELRNRWRGFQPWPGAWTLLQGKKLIVHQMKECTAITPQGEVRIEDGRLLAGCAGGSIELLEVQLEGKRRMTAGEFLRGAQLRTGQRLGT